MIFQAYVRAGQADKLSFDIHVLDKIKKESIRWKGKQDSDRQERNNVILRTTACAYLTLILAVLPLYMKDHMVMIGDAKYGFFLWTSVIMLVLSVVGAMIEPGRTWRTKTGGKRAVWSLTDWCVAAYGVVTVISTLLSGYRDVAFRGYPDWHMGLVTQLLLVWAYFLVSRWQEESFWVWMTAIAASGAVFLIGVLNRFGTDILGVFQGMDYWDWNRSNLLSTIGNINWYCGYLCTALPIAAFFFWNGRGLVRGAAGGVYVLGITSLVTQGSDSGFAALAAVLAVLLWQSTGNRNKMYRFLQTVLGIPVVCLGIRLLDLICPQRLYLLADSLSRAFLFWKGWPFVLGCLILFLILLMIRERRGSRDIWQETCLSTVIKALIIAAVLALVAVFVVSQISGDFRKMLGGSGLLKMDASWGNGRGALWGLALSGSISGGMKQFLIGAGPDCFAPYIYNLFDVDHIMAVSGQWQGAVSANAHNEWLNMLVTGGAFGLITYAGIFLTMYIRCMRRSGDHPELLLGAMCIAGYGINNIFSFQQAVSTPVIFAILAICEGICRKNSR